MGYVFQNLAIEPHGSPLPNTPTQQSNRGTPSRQNTYGSGAGNPNVNPIALLLIHMESLNNPDHPYLTDIIHSSRSDSNPNFQNQYDQRPGKRMTDRRASSRIPPACSVHHPSQAVLINPSPDLPTRSRGNQRRHAQYKSSRTSNPQNGASMQFSCI